MTPGSLPPWPVAHGPVMLREFSARDVPMAQELSTDPYVPFVGNLAGEREPGAGVGLGGPPARPLG
jgi:hypothetical protein